MFFGDKEQNSGGESGIRTHGTLLQVQRFSRPSPSTTQPSLQGNCCILMSLTTLCINSGGEGGIRTLGTGKGTTP
jgi:hypothetical protein